MILVTLQNIQNTGTAPGIISAQIALEGNTLTESETKVLLEDGLTIGGKPLRYTYEAVGHAGRMILCSRGLRAEPSPKEISFIR